VHGKKRGFHARTSRKGKGGRGKTLLPSSLVRKGKGRREGPLPCVTRSGREKKRQGLQRDLRLFGRGEGVKEKEEKKSAFPLFDTGREGGGKGFCPSM